jgi:hypothetical protein
VVDSLCGASTRNYDTLTRAICWLGALVAGLFVVLRLLSKVFLAGPLSPSMSALAIGDAVTAAAYIFALPCYFIAVYKLLGAGLGRDQWTLTPSQVNDVSYWLYILEPIYLVSLWLIKTSFLFLFIRVFSAGQVERVCLCGALKLRHALWGTLVVNTMCIGSFIITFIFQCWPISYTWTRWEGSQTGTCVNVNAMVCTHGALGIAFDFWILYLPMSQLSSMNLPIRKKLQVGGMMGIGAM